MSELPFMATENILMDAVKLGGDRQELHEAIRVHSMAAAKTVKEDGKPNDLLERIAADKRFGMTLEQLQSVMNPKNFIGMADKQVDSFIENVVNPILKNNDINGEMPEINV